MEPLEFEKVSVEEVRQALDDEDKRAKKPGSNPQGAPSEGHQLLETTIRWIESLPEAVRPTSLTSEHPRIANSLAEVWRRVELCKQYLDTLVVDRRDGQSGFSPEVAEELIVLRSHYLVMHPDNRLAWDQFAREI